MNLSLYILVLKKLPKKNYPPQAVHGAAQWMMENPNCQWNNNRVIIKAVDSIEEWENLFKSKGINFATFIEPHWDNLKTALASTDIGELVKDLPLL